MANIAHAAPMRSRFYPNPLRRDAPAPAGPVAPALVVAMAVALAACGSSPATTSTTPPKERGEACAGDEECAAGLDCFDQVCVVLCLAPADCAAGLGCHNGVCGECVVDAECANLNTCDNATRTCRTACVGDGQCQASAFCSSGGACTGKLADGSSCTRAEMCVAGRCAPVSGCSGEACDKICRPASCDDLERNGSETGIDCGGGVCPRCAIDQGCDVDNDCRSGACSDAGTCVAPILSLSAIITAEDTASTPIMPTLSTIEPVLTYVLSVDAQAAHGVVTIGVAGVIYTPVANYNGSDSFVLRATGSDSSSVVGTVAVTVTPVNDPPTLSGTPVTSLKAGTAYGFTPVVTDIDVGDTYAFTADNLPSWLTLDSATGALAGTPPQSALGMSCDITLHVSDGAAADDLDPFCIEVLDGAPPAVVGGLQAKPGNQKARLSWTNPTDSDFTGVIVRASPSCATSPTEGTAVYSGTGTSKYVTGLTNGQSVCFSVFACDALDNCSAASISTTPNRAWVPLATGMTAARRYATATVLGNKIYVVGGAPTAQMQIVEEFDGAAWTNCGGSCASLNTGRYIHTAAAVDSSHIIVLGGIDSAGYPYVGSYKTEMFNGSAWSTSYADHGAYSDDVLAAKAGASLYVMRLNKAERYDDAADTWTACADLPDLGSSVSNKDDPYTRGATIAVDSANKIHVIGGRTWNYSTSRYDLSQYERVFDGSAWSHRGMGKYIASAASAILSDPQNGTTTLYVIGGQNCDAGASWSCSYPGSVATVLATTFDGSSWSAWAEKPEKLPVALHGAAAAVLDGHIYLFGGANGYSIAVDTVYVYTPAYDW